MAQGCGYEGFGVGTALPCLPDHCSLTSAPNPPVSAANKVKSVQKLGSVDPSPHLWDLVGGDHQTPRWRALGVGQAGLGHSRLKEPHRKFDSSFW